MLPPPLSMFFEASISMIPSTFKSERFTRDKIWNIDKSFCIECDLFSMSVVLSPKRYLLLLMYRMQQDDAGTKYEARSTHFHLEMCPESWTLILKTTPQLRASHLLCTCSSAASPYRCLRTRVTGSKILSPLQVQLEAKKELHVQHVYMIMPTSSEKYPQLYSQQQIPTERRTYSALPAIVHSTSLLE